MDYAIRTCAKCGQKLPANELKKIRVKRGASFSSRKSVTPLTFMGAFLGSKKAKGAIESWAFTTSSRKGKAVGTKEINLCSSCYANQPSGNGGGGFLFNLLLSPFWLIAKIFTFLPSLFRGASVAGKGFGKALSFIYIKPFVFVGKIFFSIIKTLSPYVIKLAKIVGLGALVGAKKGINHAVTLRKNAKTKQVVEKMDSAEILQEAFESPEFLEIAEFMFSMEVAGSDENITSKERKLINDKLNISEANKFISSKISEDQKLYNAYKTLIKDHLKKDELLARSLVTNLFFVAEVDGKVSYEELDAIKKISSDIGLSKDIFEEIKNTEHKRIVDNGNRFFAEDIENKIKNLLS